MADNYKKSKSKDQKAKLQIKNYKPQAPNRKHLITDNNKDQNHKPKIKTTNNF